MRKNVYSSMELIDVGLKIKNGDKRFFINENSLLFGEPTADLLWYKKLILMCPEKGVGWIQQ